jgi:invasion protein IalB
MTIMRITRHLGTILFAAAAIMFASNLALAQTPKLLGKHKDWEAYAFSDSKNGKTCFMTSTPVNMEPAKVKHGDVYGMVTHRPKAKIRDEVSLNVGYPFKARSEVVISIGKKQNKMYTSVDTAWSYDEADDKKLVVAMRAGDEMIVQGQSKRGTRVSYRFSLSGFTNAYKAISKACKK